MSIRSRVGSFLPVPIKEFVKARILQISFIRPFRFPNTIIIQSPEYTLVKCLDLINSRVSGAYCRFGDGEINLANGKTSRHQAPNRGLQKELRQVLSLRTNGVLKALAIHSDRFGHEPEMRPGVHKWTDAKAKKILFSSYEYFIGCKIYSAVALHYALVYRPDIAEKFLAELGYFKPIFVGGEHNDLKIIRRLLNISDVVTTPSKGAYDSIDRVESEVLSYLDYGGRDYSVVITACGAMGKALIGRLLSKRGNIFIVDIGSVVDVFHGRTKWSWVRLSGKDPAYWNGVLSRIEMRRASRLAAETNR